MTRRLPLATVLVLVGLFVLPASSPAHPLIPPASLPVELGQLLRARQHAPSRRGFESRFELAAGHGYRLVVLGKGDTVLIEVGRPKSLSGGSPEESRVASQSLTAYAARGTVTRRRIAASFGKLGRIDVRFHPTGKAVALPLQHRCRGGDHFTRQLGVFAGAIRFDGEQRYVAVHAHRAPGRVRSPLSLHCLPDRSRSSASRPRLVGQPSDGGFRGSLGAFSRHAVESTELYAFVNHDRTLTVAVVEESLGRIAEFHLGLSVSRSRVLTADDALTQATLAPPPPFHGTGTYRAAPDGTKSWTGPLSVSFPGAPRWPLTGEQFRVALNAGF